MQKSEAGVSRMQVLLSYVNLISAANSLGPYLCFFAALSMYWTESNWMLNLYVAKLVLIECSRHLQLIAPAVQDGAEFSEMCHILWPVVFFIELIFNCDNILCHTNAANGAFASARRE